MMHFILLDKK